MLSGLFNQSLFLCCLHETFFSTTIEGVQPKSLREPVWPTISVQAAEISSKALNLLTLFSKIFLPRGSAHIFGNYLNVTLVSNIALKNLNFLFETTDTLQKHLRHLLLSHQNVLEKNACLVWQGISKLDNFQIRSVCNFKFEKIPCTYKTFLHNIWRCIVLAQSAAISSWRRNVLKNVFVNLTVSCEAWKLRFAI